ncbi:MAG: MotA/TolQ/ExbB proton channel family protein [Deltaproteobacteria bacterium]|nr:MAG: MotA/TolQ/ExbB proton channel family protein [Deltaproteobacteria bacterium]
MGEGNLFNGVAESFIVTLTHTINTYSGILQLSVYLLIFITFGFALIKTYHSLRALVYCDFEKIKAHKGLYNFRVSTKTPLSVIAAGFFAKAKKHYLEEGKNPLSNKTIPPDAFVRDAAFQFSERYFESKFLEPMSMLAGLMPPLGFIGTIMGMVIHFLSNTGGLKSDITIVGVATALYTTFLGLIFYTFLEFLKRFFFTLAQKRIDEGLEAVSDIEASSGIRGGNEN